MNDINEYLESRQAYTKEVLAGIAKGATDDSIDALTAKLIFGGDCRRIDNDFKHIFTHRENPDLELKISISDAIAQSAEKLSLMEIDEIIETLEAALKYYKDLYDQKVREIDPYWV